MTLEQVRGLRHAADQIRGNFVQDVRCRLFIRQLAHRSHKKTPRVAPRGWNVPPEESHCGRTFPAANQVRSLRARQLIALYKAGERKGAYWGIRQPITTYPAPHTLPCPFDKTTELALTATRLKKMDDTLQERLINWGYAVSDASLRSWFDANLPAPDHFPYPSSGV